MQQAIEEGFILDVRRNYSAYSAAFRLGERLQEDPRVDSKQARRALARWLSLHPTNVAQKVELTMALGWSKRDRSEGKVRHTAKICSWMLRASG
jgi:hypothetical protein